jgi:hypothetical protein
VGESAAFCRLRTDTNCSTPLTLRLDGTVSHGMRQFPEAQLPHVIDFIPFLRRV